MEKQRNKSGVILVHIIYGDYWSFLLRNFKKKTQLKFIIAVYNFHERQWISLDMQFYLCLCVGYCLTLSVYFAFINLKRNQTGQHMIAYFFNQRMLVVSYYRMQTDRSKSKIIPNSNNIINLRFKLNLYSINCVCILPKRPIQMATFNIECEFVFVFFFVLHYIVYLTMNEST